MQYLTSKLLLLLPVIVFPYIHVWFYANIQDSVWQLWLNLYCVWTGYGFCTLMDNREKKSFIWASSKKTVKMNKSLFLCCSIIALVLFLSAQAEGKKKSFLARVCSKCDYCKTDPNCDGCKKCGECISGLKTVDIEAGDYYKFRKTQFILSIFIGRVQVL